MNTPAYDTIIAEVGELSPEGVSNAQQTAFRDNGWSMENYRYPKGAMLTVEYGPAQCIGYLQHGIVEERVGMDRGFITIRSKANAQ